MISSVILLLSENHTSCDFCSFKFVDDFFLVQNIVNLVDCTLENSIYSAVVVCQLSQVWLYYSGLPYPYWFSVNLFCPLWREEFWIFQLKLWNCLFLPSVLSVFTPCILKLCCCLHLGWLCLLSELITLPFYNVPLYLWHVLALKSSLSVTNITIPS